MLLLLASFAALCLSTPIPLRNKPAVIDARRSVLATMSEGMSSVVDSASSQYTSTMVSLTPTQQIGAIVGASCTLSLILITVIYVVLKGRKEREVEKAKQDALQVKVKAELTRIPTAYVTTASPVGASLRQSSESIRRSDPLTICDNAHVMFESPLTPSEVMEKKMALYQKLSGANKIPAAPAGFFSNSFEVVMLGESPTLPNFGAVPDQIEDQYLTELSAPQERRRGLLSVHVSGLSMTADVLAQMSHKLNNVQGDEEIYKTASNLDIGQAESQADIGTSREFLSIV